jgi:hypothetical protein
VGQEQECCHARHAPDHDRAAILALIVGESYIDAKIRARSGSVSMAVATKESK